MEIAIQPIKVRRINDNATHCMSNGCVTPVEACRQISLTKKHNVRNVYKEQFTGKASAQSTWQLLNVGDIVVRAVRAKQKSPITISCHIFKADGSFETMVDTCALRKAINSIAPELMAWLVDIVYSEKVKAKRSYLPAGHGWDGVTTSQRRMKHYGLSRVIPKDMCGELREALVSEAMVSTYRNQPTSWDDALPMVKQINNRNVYPAAESPNPDAHVYWILFHGKAGMKMDKMGVEVARPCSQTLTWSSDFLDSKVEGVRGASIELPKTVQFAIKVFMRPYLNRKIEGYGAAWILYKR